MSSVCWLINSRKCLVSVGLLTAVEYLEFVELLTGANVSCLLDYEQAQV